MRVLAASCGSWARVRYPEIRELFITEDAGGRNACRSLTWKHELPKVAHETYLYESASLIDRLVGFTAFTSSTPLV